jgi:hypothetical protein
MVTKKGAVLAVKGGKTRNKTVVLSRKAAQAAAKRMSACLKH